MDKFFQGFCNIYPHYKLNSKIKKTFFYLIFSIFKFFLIGPFKLNFKNFIFLAYPQKKNYSRSLLSKVKIHDESEVNFFIDNINENSLFLDCGANQGFYTIPIAGHHRNSDIHAFEPSDQEMEYLKKNISVNDFKNINTHKLAIGDKEGEFKFKDDNFENNSTKGGYIINDNNLEEKDLSIIPTTTLDNFISKKNIDKNKKIFIKIDLEGYDFNAIYGSKNILENYFTVILFEFSKIAVENKIYSKASFQNFLDEKKLVILDINGKRLTLDILHDKLNLLKKRHNVCGNFLIVKDKYIEDLEF
tara:strand:+ start:29 stop:937 length:909 start_codon:yes stop_codon:yes gene_type:complete